MGRKEAGLILLSVGVLCGIIYILIKLGAATTTATAVSGLLMYTGIVALIAGLIVFATSKAKSLL
jgi:hypothetical protein